MPSISQEVEWAPHPTEEPHSHTGDEPRCVFCQHYQACLDVAVDNDWDSWTCRRCPLSAVAPTKPAPKDFANDRRRGPGWGM